ncbi:g3784 [Coccomyxa elongata]
MDMAAPDISAESFGLTPHAQLEAGTPVLDADEGEELAKRFDYISLVLGDNLNMGQGSLYITTRRIIWVGGTEKSYAADFQHINMHAISTDQSAFQRPCIYMQMEPSTSGFAGDEADTDDLENEETPEVRLVPSDASALEDLFQVLCDCAALNPDPGQEGDDEDAEFFYDEEEVLAGADDGSRAAMLDHYDSLLQMPRADDLDELVAEDPERFDDAEEEAGEEDGHPNNVPHPTRPEQ